MMRKSVFLLALVALVACGERANRNIAFEVELRDHQFTLQARGDVVSSESIPIHVPNTVPMPLNIEWLLPEYTAVRKGDVVVRFADDDLLSQRSSSLVDIANQSLLIRNHMMDSGTAHTQIEHESERVAGETVIAQTFADFDPRYFSRIEIIDAIGDLEFLGVEASFYDWQFGTHEQRTRAELARIEAEKSSVELQLQRQDSALGASELVSPADGVFLHARTPWGQKIGKGRTMFPGSAVGMLPVDGKLQARIYVPKSDAIGIEVGQAVKLRIDVDIERELAGEIVTVSPMAISRNPQDPRQYVVVSATLDEDSKNRTRIGSALTATIVTASLRDAIVLPQQAIFNDDDKHVVYLVVGNQFVTRQVSLGFRSPTLVEVKTGLDDGDLVSLVAPVGLSS
ncbi:MAG: efflux RND transporter periplasmic adaptor subunit [Gammaproteobacteria bacterium]|nr:efflux RND transporter periplasmic adaptor subunit [Gammaproteobacteria bacterium]